MTDQEEFSTCQTSPMHNRAKSCYNDQDLEEQNSPSTQNSLPTGKSPLLQYPNHNLNEELFSSYNSIEDPQESQSVLLIRHGISVFNQKSDQYKKETGICFRDKAAREFNMNPELLDSPLNEAGLQQAKLKGKSLQSLKFHTVFVSPMLRTLQTARALFQEHPDRENIKLIVLPYVCEVVNKMCDISTLTESTIKEFPEFDFSYLRSICSDIQAWQLSIIQDSQTRSELEKKFREQGQSYSSIMISKLEETFPKSIETYNSLFERAQLAKQFLKDYARDHNLQVSGGALAIVSHNAFLRNFTSAVPDNGKLQNQADKGMSFGNCETVNYTIK